MIKKIKIIEIKIGMFVSDLNCSWLNHPFVGRGKSIKVDSKEIIQKIMGSKIKEVYIDTKKGLDVGEVPAKKEVEQKVQEKVDEVVEEKLDLIKRVPISEEIFNAKRIKVETVKKVKRIMDDVRMGRQIESVKIEEEVDNIIESVFRNADALMGLARIRNANDFLYNHSLSVCVMSISFGKYLGFDEKVLREVGVGAILHDIGATKVPQHIVNKKSALSEMEYEKIKEHVQYGRILLEQTQGISEISILTAYQHHERIDGSGYPLGLKGDEISIYGQVIGIVDVYDALTTKRSYRNKIQPTDALRMLYEWRGSKFESELVQKFVRSVGIYPVGTLVSLDSDLLGVVISLSDENLLQPVIRIVYDTKNDKMVVPYEVDLSLSSGKGKEGSIVGYENPDKWNLVPEMYL